MFVRKEGLQSEEEEFVIPLVVLLPVLLSACGLCGWRDLRISLISASFHPHDRSH